MDETYVINQLKEDTCFVSLDFNVDMAMAQKKPKENSLAIDYVLPDFTTIRRGYIRSKDEAGNGEQVIRMNNERFAVPELLFRPSDIGIQQMGITEAIVHVVDNFPTEVQSHLYNNILLTGGSCNLPNFKERVEKEVRMLAPAECDVRVILASK
jgi:actin-related protein 6